MELGYQCYMLHLFYVLSSIIDNCGIHGAAIDRWLLPLPTEANVINVSTRFTNALNESTPDDTMVNSVKANNEPTNYMIVNQSYWNAFRIDVNQFQGNIYVNNSALIDFETARYHVLIIHAWNTDAVTATGTFTISLSDINDNAPEFPDGPYLAYLWNNPVPPYINVTTIRAYDRDTGYNNDISYTLLGERSELFDIHPYEGHVTTTNLSAEILLASYTLTVMATDNGTPSLSTNATLKICLDPDCQSGSSVVQIGQLLLACVLTSVISFRL